MLRKKRDVKSRSKKRHGGWTCDAGEKEQGRSKNKNEVSKKGRGNRATDKWLKRTQECREFFKVRSIAAKIKAKCDNKRGIVFQRTRGDGERGDKDTLHGDGTDRQKKTPTAEDQNPKDAITITKD